MKSVGGGRRRPAQRDPVRRRLGTNRGGATFAVYTRDGDIYVEQVPSEFRELRVRVRNISTRADLLVYRARSGGANAAGVTRPTYVPGREGFLWARTNLGSGTGNRIVRYTLRGSRLSYAQGSRRYVSTAWAGGPLGVATASAFESSTAPGQCADAGVQYCTVQLTGRLRFGSRP